jgi:hypothetical protein
MGSSSTIPRFGGQVNTVKKLPDLHGTVNGFFQRPRTKRPEETSDQHAAVGTSVRKKIEQFERASTADYSFCMSAACWRRLNEIDA